ncbi:MAG: DUF1963 domain-containing protein [Armatimonadota bacterium]
MAHELFYSRLVKYGQPTKIMKLLPGDPGQVPVTKIGGVPWWPASTERPKCPQGHLMSFVAQIRLDDTPGLAIDSPILLSFHYCNECAYEGNMSFGYSYRDAEIYGAPIFNEGYSIDFFTQVDGIDTDSKGIVAEEMVDAATVVLHPRIDYPSLRDIIDIPGLVELCPEWDDPTVNGPVYIDIEDEESVDPKKPYYTYHGCKIGGWPAWVQYAEWPVRNDGTRFNFVAQLSDRIGEGVTWVGGSVYLFIDRQTDNSITGTFVFQNT